MEIQLFRVHPLTPTIVYLVGIQNHIQDEANGTSPWDIKYVFASLISGKYTL